MSQHPSSLISFFTMIAEPVRFEILNILLKEKETTVSTLVKKINKPQTMVSYHLGCLKDCGLVSGKKNEKDGRIIMYSLHEEEVVERIFLIAENFLLKHEICKNYPSCQIKNYQI